MKLVLAHPTGVEMTADARFRGRVQRLAALSLVALGTIWALAVTTLDAGIAVGASLLAGWVSMPVVLGISLVRPGARWLVAVPSTLVTLPLLAICLTVLPDDVSARAGWLLVTAGILVGDVSGLWFWYRLLPVPASLNDPYSVGRWVMIGAHVGLIVIGLVLVVVGAVSS